MIRRLKQFLCVILPLLAACRAPAEELKAFTVYDPANHNPEAVYHYPPQKADDMVADFNIVTGENGKPALEITFRGTDVEAESAQPRISWSDFKLPAGYVFRHLRITVESTDDLLQAGGAVGYPGGHKLFPMPIRKGDREILVTPNDLDPWTPIDCNMAAFWTKSAAKWRICKIEILAAKVTAQPLPIVRSRASVEVLPDGEKARVLHGMLHGTDRDAGELDAELSYTPDEIIFKLKSKLGRKPVAAKTEHDGDVWQDECQEIFLSPAADGVERYQYTANVSGAVYDQKQSYNDTVGSVINDLCYTMPCRRESSYADGIWSGSYAFPLAELKFDPARDRVMMFRVGQQLTDPERIISWPFLPADHSFLSLDSYAAAVLNPRPFGTGTLDIDQILVLNDGQGMRVIADAKDVPAGDYSLELRLRRPAGDIKKVIVPTKLDTGNRKLEITYSGPCPSGGYTASLLLTNRENASIFAGADTVYARPVQVREDIVLNPTPKEIKWKEGFFRLADGDGITIPADASERTKLTARQFAELLSGASGVDREITTAPGNIELRLAPGKPQGFQLSITPEKITVTGSDEPGLYYGMREVLQIYNVQMSTVEGRPVPCCEITDWPDVERRIGILILLPGHGYFENPPVVREKRTIPFLKRFIEYTYLTNRFNTLIVDMSESVELPHHPEMNDSPMRATPGNIPRPLYSMAELTELAEFCRDNFIEIIPSLPYHRNGWIYRNHQEFNLYGNHDVEHPNYDEVYFGVADELIDAFAKTAPVRFFFTDLSELWLDCSAADRENVAKMDPVGRFERGINKINAYCKKRGIRMVMYSDMLNPYWPATFQYASVIDRIPREVVLLHWQSDGALVNGPIHYFHDKGFELWGMGSCLQDRLDADSRTYLSAYGKGMPELGDAYEAYDDDSGQYWSSNALYYAADYGWNLRREIPEYSDRKADGSIQKMRQTGAVKGNPAASENVDPIDLSPVWNDNIDTYAAANLPGGKAKFPEKVVDVCHIPMFLTRHFTLLKPGSSLELPLNRKASALIFLTASHLTQGETAAVRGLSVTTYAGVPAGEFLVRYADGTEETVPMRLHANYDFIDQAPEMRATKECRYALLLPREDGGYFTLHQYEWINPHPEKEITSLGYRHDDPPLADGTRIPTPMMLFALSARQVQ